MLSKLIRIASIIFLVILLIVWGLRSADQNQRLRFAEEQVVPAMRFIKSGFLGKSDAILCQQEEVSRSLRNEWAATPGIRTRERVFTSHINNIRAAHDKRLTAIDDIIRQTSADLEHIPTGQTVITLSVPRDGVTLTDPTLKRVCNAVGSLRDGNYNEAVKQITDSIVWWKQNGVRYGHVEDVLLHMQQLILDQQQSARERNQKMVNNFASILRECRFDSAIAEVAAQTGQIDTKLKSALLELAESLKRQNFSGAVVVAKLSGQILSEMGITNSIALDLMQSIERERLRVNERRSAIITKVTESLKEGQFEQASSYLCSTQQEQGLIVADVILLKALTTLVDRLKSQDFTGAMTAANQLSALLVDAGVTNVTLPYLSYTIEKEKAENIACHQRIATEVKNLLSVRTLQESSQFKPVLKGKVMIWDTTKSTVEGAYELLPDDLRASSRDGIVTIFSVIRREQVNMGTYSVSKQPAYKEKMTIGVAYWPEKSSAGTAIVWGGDPPFMRAVTYHPGYGSSVNIRNWVKDLPRESKEESERAAREAQEQRFISGSAGEEVSRENIREQQRKEEQQQREKQRLELRAEHERKLAIEREEKQREEVYARERLDKLRASFLQPRIGSAVKLELKTGGTVAGALESFDQNTITISSGSATLSIKCSDLADRSKAMFFLDDYMRYHGRKKL